MRRKFASSRKSERRETFVERAFRPIREMEKHLEWLRDLDTNGNEFLTDMQNKMSNGFTAKQNEAVKKAYEREMKKRPAPSGDGVEFRGVVKSKKPTKFGDSWGLIIETGVGWSVWTVAPKGQVVNVGDSVSLVGDLTPSADDKSFAFAKNTRFA